MDDRTLVFLHVPKAAGATLRKLLFEVYPEGTCYWIKPSGSDRKTSRRTLKEMPEERKRALRLVTGHFPYGAMERLLPQPLTYITILREPVDRVRSLYQYVRKLPDHPHHGIAQGSFEEFALSPEQPALDNMQTRLLAGGMATASRAPLDKWVDEDDYARALEHLRTFAAVGVQERFDEAVAAMARLFGWGPLPAVDSAHVEPRKLDVPEDVRTAIEERNRFDARLYQEARVMCARLCDGASAEPVGADATPNDAAPSASTRAPAESGSPVSRLWRALRGQRSSA